MDTQTNKTYWFLFSGDRILLQKENQTLTIPCSPEPPVPFTNRQEIGDCNGIPCVAGISPEPLKEDATWFPCDLRTSYDFLAAPLYDKAGKASQLLYWDTHSRFCPVCGATTRQTAPITKKCPACGYEIYPSVSVAVLVLIRKEDRILLVHARNFKGTFNSLVAGFLETGETLEQCVAREVEEETGLKIKNITYFGNQPWPYPNNLMVGFMADYAGGEIRLQDEELSSGDFYTRDRLPELPRKLSLARKMIDWWIEQA